MNEQVRKLEIATEKLDAIIGVYIFRQNAKGVKEVLLVRHSVTGKWYFPGGKVRADEDMKTALRRELREELGIDYSGKFGVFTVNKYEINSKKLAIANVTALDPLPSEPKLQEGNAIKDFVWTADPMSYNLTEQAKEIIKAKMEKTTELPKREKIKNPKNQST